MFRETVPYQQPTTSFHPRHHPWFVLRRVMIGRKRGDKGEVKIKRKREHRRTKAKETGMGTEHRGDKRHIQTWVLCIGMSMVIPHTNSYMSHQRFTTFKMSACVCSLDTENTSTSCPMSLMHWMKPRIAWSTAGSPYYCITNHAHAKVGGGESTINSTASAGREGGYSCVLLLPYNK